MTKHAPLPCLVTYKCGIRAELMGVQMLFQRLLRRKTENELAEADDNLSLHHSGDSCSHIPIKHFIKHYLALKLGEDFSDRAILKGEGLRAWGQGEEMKQTWMISAVI